MRRISVCGAGYVGLVTAACLSSLGNDVLVYDVDGPRIAGLQAGRVPFFEPGLDALAGTQTAAGRLRFSADPASIVKEREIVFIAVGTPFAVSSPVNLSGIRAVLDAVYAFGSGDILVVNKSTIPVSAADQLAAEVAERNTASTRVRLASNPEFLRQGSAIADFMHPARIVIAADAARTVDELTALFAPLSAPLVVTDMRTAAMIKYAANAFLAAKISFANEIAEVCSAFGVPIEDVTRGIGLDPRIGAAFLEPGLGFGGSCLPKDLAQLREFARGTGVPTPLLDAVETINALRPRKFVEHLERLLGGLSGKTVAVFGVAFKGGTGDTRASRALEVIDELLALGAEVQAFDPEAVFPDAYRGHARASASEAAENADAIAVTTDWNEFKTLDWHAIARVMRGRLVVDGRHFLDKAGIESAGLDYVRV